MRTLNQLLDSEDPAFPLIRQWALNLELQQTLPDAPASVR